MAKRVITTFRCPIHGETTPSLALYADGTFHCFGCGTSGRWEDNGSEYIIRFPPLFQLTVAK